MEYTNILEPLIFISVSLLIGMIIGALYMYFKTKIDVELMEVDLQISHEQLAKCQSTLLSYMDKYEDSDYEAY
tara:strand:- start:134 stop:352 length:219 start_codon:yes stop_codon:yes gene_type:complete